MFVEIYLTTEEGKFQLELPIEGGFKSVLVQGATPQEALRNMADLIEECPEYLDI